MNMTNSELIDKVIEIIKANTGTQALGAFDCALRGRYPLSYEKCINEIVELINNNESKTLSYGTNH